MDGDLQRSPNPCQPAVNGRDRAVPGCVLEAKNGLLSIALGMPLPSGLPFLRRECLSQKSSNFWGIRAGAGIDNESDQVSQEYPVDALALRGDEGRGTLR